MKFGWKLGICRRFVALLLLCAPLLVACTKSTVPVPIHGVNHAADAFKYVLVDPANPENTRGGEMVDPFTAGGTMCCYALPATWRPGIQVEIRETHWLPKRQDKSVPEVSTRQVVELPAYVDGKIGELWVIRAPDGQLSLVASNYQPDHANWPGKIKGWPVPGAEQRRASQDLYIKEAQNMVDLCIFLLERFKKSPSAQARVDWEHSALRRPDELIGYTGPGDAAYMSKLEQGYETSLAHARLTLQREKAARR